MPAVPCFLIKISKHSIETGGAQVYGLLLPLPFFNFESKIKGTGGGGTSLRSELHLLIIGANILGWEFGRRSTVGNQNWCTETQSCRWTPLFTSLQFKAEIQFLFISFPYQACQAGITIISHAYLYVCQWLTGHLHIALHYTYCGPIPLLYPSDQVTQRTARRRLSPIRHFRRRPLSDSVRSRYGSALASVVGRLARLFHH